MKILAFLCALFPVAATAESCSDLLNFNMKRLRSAETVNFCEAYQGKVILAVNTASNCGFTPQFKGLEALYEKYKDQGLVIVGFPSDDFFQEFNDPEETAKVCYINYGVTFPMFEKSSVRGEKANTFFKNLAKISGTTPKWNFYKYLINPKDLSVEAFGNFTKPIDIESKIQALLTDQ